MFSVRSVQGGGEFVSFALDVFYGQHPSSKVVALNYSCRNIRLNAPCPGAGFRGIVLKFRINWKLMRNNGPFEDACVRRSIHTHIL